MKKHSGRKSYRKFIKHGVEKYKYSGIKQKLF